MGKFLGIDFGSGESSFDSAAYERDSAKKRADIYSNRIKQRSFSLASGNINIAENALRNKSAIALDIGNAQGTSTITKEELELLSSIVTGRIGDIRRRRAAPGRSQVLLSNRGL